MNVGVKGGGGKGGEPSSLKTSVRKSGGIRMEGQPAGFDVPAPATTPAPDSASLHINERYYNNKSKYEWFSSTRHQATAAGGAKYCFLSWVMFVVLCAVVLQTQVGTAVGTTCSPGMDKDCISFAVYRMREGESLTEVADRYREPVENVLAANQLNMSSSTLGGQEVFVPLRCVCNASMVLFQAMPTYAIIKKDTLTGIAQQKYQFMTGIDTIASASSVTDVDYIMAGATLNIPIPCACNRSGNPVFTHPSYLTYVPQQSDTLSLISAKFNSSKEAMRAVNGAAQSVMIDATKPIIIPSNRTFPPMLYPPLPPAQPNCSVPDVCPKETVKQTKQTGPGESQPKEFPLAILISLLVGGIILFILVGLAIAYIITKGSKRRRHRHRRQNDGSQQGSSVTRHFFSGTGATETTTGSTTGPDAHGHSGATNAGAFEEPDRIIVFSYKELAEATDNFSTANKIGQGAFGTVYYAKLRNREAAIKKMNLVKSQEFRQELKILNKVHHKHLVELIGFCRENFLFLVYEYCEQGTLASHLHAPAAYGALTWTTRVQAASDAAQALEYIHEHTRPTYVHRDIKSNNILLDKNLRAKVADFGLIKLIGQDEQNGPMTTKLVGTFGYMAPEYVKFGDLSPKSDVYSFGVVLLELLTGQQALSMLSTQSVAASSSNIEHRKALTDSVVPLIKEMRSDKEVAAIVDPELRDNYPVVAARKLAQLAVQCTADTPQERPDMKRIVYILDEILKFSQHGPEASEKLELGCIMDSLAR